MTRALIADPEARGLATLVLALIVGGTWFYRIVEDLSWLDSTYFTIVTLTTVGFGDIAPTTNAGKIFTMLYLLIGIGLIVTFLSQIATHMTRAQSDARTGRDQDVSDRPGSARPDKQT